MTRHDLPAGHALRAAREKHGKLMRRAADAAPPPIWRRISDAGRRGHRLDFLTFQHDDEA